jgi:hypothetical protein
MLTSYLVHYNTLPSVYVYDHALAVVSLSFFQFKAKKKEMKSESTVFWDVTYSEVEIYRRFLGKYCLHLQGGEVYKKQTEICLLFACCLLVTWFTFRP